jgi:hypothetical protein
MGKGGDVLDLFQTCCYTPRVLTFLVGTMPIVVSSMPVVFEITHREVSDGELQEIIWEPRQNRAAAHAGICKAIADCAGSKDASYTDIPQNRRYEFIWRLMQVGNRPLRDRCNRFINSLSPDQLAIFQRLLSEFQRLLSDIRQEDGSEELPAD